MLGSLLNISTIKMTPPACVNKMCFAYIRLLRSLYSILQYVEYAIVNVY